MGSFFDVVDSGLRTKLTELWKKKTVSLLLGLGVDPVVILDVGTSRLCPEFGLLNGRHFDIVRLEEDD